MLRELGEEEQQPGCSAYCDAHLEEAPSPTVLVNHYIQVGGGSALHTSVLDVNSSS